MDYNKQFTDFINSLRKNKQVIINSQAILSPLSKKQIRSILKRYKVKLAPALMEFYSQVNGADIIWYTPNASLSEIGGRIYINSLEQLLQQLQFTTHYMEEGLISPSQKKELDHFRVFEGSSDQTVGFFEREGVISDQLYAYDTFATAKTCQPLNCSLKDYLTTIFQTEASVVFTNKNISKVA